jgi:hypothetical protein
MDGADLTQLKGLSADQLNQVTSKYVDTSEWTGSIDGIRITSEQWANIQGGLKVKRDTTIYVDGSPVRIPANW